MCYNKGMFTMLKETCKYLKKSFWLLAFVALLPSIGISFFVKPFSSITFLPSLFVGRIDYSFSDIFMMMLTPINGASFWGGLIGHTIFFICFGIACIWGVCVTEKHFKTGELSLKVSVHQFTSYLFPVFLALAMWSALYLIAAVAQSGLISLIHYVCGVTPPSFIYCFLSTIVSLAIFYGVMYCSIHLLFLPLIMVSYGYGWRESFVESLRLTSQNFKSLMTGFFLPLLIFIFADAVLTLGTALLSKYAGMSAAAKYWIDFIISVVIHTLTIMYLFIYDIVAFYRLSGFERRDIKRYGRRR